MSETRSIEIDFDVHQLIVANQSGFHEQPNAVLRRLLGLEAIDQPRAKPDSEVPIEVRQSTRKHTRGMLRIQATEYPYRNAKEALCTILRHLQRDDPEFLARLAVHPKCIGRNRRTLARRPEDLYPGRSDLYAKHTEPIADGWLLGTNTSTSQKVATIRAAAEVAGLKLGLDLVVDL